MTRRIQFRLKSLILLISCIAVLLAVGQLWWPYLRTKAAWRDFPRGGQLEWAKTASLLRPRYEMDLSGNPTLRDHHMATFSDLRTITHIDISHTPLTDRCLIHLKSLQNLKSIDVTGTQISQRGADELREALPDCTVYR